MRDEEESRDEAEQRIEATEAFSLLAHGTRMAAMEVLWEAEEPLRFSEIADRAGISDTGNFNYHFGKLVDHFVRKEGETYQLTRSGRQAMTAVLTGDVTENPSFEGVPVDHQCPYCGADVELHHDADLLRVVCTSCSGSYSGAGEHTPGDPNPEGTLATFNLPAAGLRDREPEAILRAALQRVTSHARDVANRLCPECSGPLDLTATVCTDHDPDGVCENCGARYVGLGSAQCRNCQNRAAGTLALLGLADPRVRQYFHDHGHDPFDPGWEGALAFFSVYEQVHSTDPVDFEAIWNLEGETLSIRVDGDGHITDVTRDGPG